MVVGPLDKLEILQEIGEGAVARCTKVRVTGTLAAVAGYSQATAGTSDSLI